MAIEYRIDAPLAPLDLADLFRRAGVLRPVEDLERIGAMIEGADLTITAWDGEVLVGIARALTDRAWCCYLADLAVAAEYRNRGIGRQLVQLLREKVGEGVVVVALSKPDETGYQPRLGFTWAENAWKIPRKF